jgi:hypothetical protein
VQRLRAVHVSGAWALFAVLVTWPALGGSPAAADVPPDARAIVLVGLAVLLVSSVVVCLPSIADRLSPTADPGSAVRGRRLGWVLALPWVALPLAVVAVVRLARADDLTVPGSPVTGMPGITGALEIQFAVQAVAVGVLFLIALVLPRGASSMQPITPAAHGFALPMLAAAAWLVAGGLSAAVALQVESLLTSGSATAATPYHFAAVTVLPLASALVVSVGVAVRRTSRAARAEADAVRAEYVTDDELRGRVTARHLGRIARARAFAKLTDSVPTYLLSLVLVTLLAVGVVAAVYAMTPPDARSRLVRGETAGVFTAYASALMIGVAIAFFVVALLAYRYPALRRWVGVIWDLTSFWPRAVHPLAPPSYGEKAVPDLVGRLQDEAADRIVVLSAHSQGSVLAVASILQLPSRTAKNVCLLTYGSPLTRLYAAFFPRYYNVEAFTESMGRLGAPADDRAAWPWINLYRHTDPIGSWVLRRPQTGARLPPAEVDVLLHDPAPYTEGARRWPAINGHVRYFPADDFEAALRTVVALRRPDPQPAADSTPPEAGTR